MDQEEPMKILREIQDSTRKMESDLEAIKKKNEEFCEFMKFTSMKQKEEAAHRKELEAKITQLTSEVERLKKAEKSKNVILRNFSYDKNLNLDIRTTVLNLFQTLMANFDVNSVEDVFLVGKQDIKPILIKFKTQFAKQQLFKNVKLLKENKLFITNDLDREVRMKRKSLRECVRKLDNASIKASIQKDKICIDDQLFEENQVREKYAALMKIPLKPKRMNKGDRGARERRETKTQEIHEERETTEMEGTSSNLTNTDDTLGTDEKRQEGSSPPEVLLSTQLSTPITNTPKRPADGSADRTSAVKHFRAARLNFNQSIATSSPNKKQTKSTEEATK